VVYHMGFESDVVVKNKKVKLTLVPNPSHLEAVNPVVLGMARASQTALNDSTRRRVLPVLVHGDSAFAGQGFFFLFFFSKEQNFKQNVYLFFLKKNIFNKMYFFNTKNSRRCV
jgi:2-oxoglutarate dehydrogenase E1 component